MFDLIEIYVEDLSGTQKVGAFSLTKFLVSYWSIALESFMGEPHTIS
jgi:hypothetical protein